MKPAHVLSLFAAFAASSAVIAAPLPIAALNHTTPVDFEQEIMPFLRDNCLSCHCKTTTKGGLNLETPELMLKGGDTGPGLKTGKGADSLVLQAAAHQDDDLKMPPRDNKAKARNLTPEQLALLKLWIDQGAKPSPKREKVIVWQPLPQSVNAILAVTVTPDGQFAACARANRISFYHLPSGRLLTTETAHRDQINALAASPDGTLFASGGYREVKLWRRSKDAGKPAQPLSTSADNSKLARADGKTLVLLSAEGKEIAKVDHGEPITAFAVRDDGMRFATAGGNFAKLWSADGKQVAELRGNRHAREHAEVRERMLQVETGTVAYRKEGVQTAEKALQAAKDRVKKSADAIAPKQQELLAKQKALTDAQAAKTAAEQALANAEAESKKADAKLQEAATKAAQLAAAATEAIKGVAVVDANKLATDAATALQDAAKARTERDQREAQRKQAADKIEPANKQLTDAGEALKKAQTAKEVAEAELNLAKAEEQRNAATVTTAKTAVDAAEGIRKKADETLQTARQAATTAELPIRTLAFSPDGSAIVTAGDDQLIHTWSAETGAAFDVLAGHKATITSLAFAPNGEIVSTASDGAALAWNLTPQWKLERTIGTSDGKSPFADRIESLAFSPDGRFLAIGGGEPSRGGEIKVLDVQSGGSSAQSAPKFARDLPSIHSDAVLSLDFSPDGKFLASGAADKIARVTELGTGKVVKSFEGHTHHVLGVSWSLDGRTLATAGADNVVKVWDFTTGDRKKNIEGYDKEVTSVRFLGASDQLLTSSGDNKVRIVGADGKEIRVLPDVADFVQSAAATAEGKLILAGGQDSILRVWKAADGTTLLKFSP